jgi:hypothetical protein
MKGNYYSSTSEEGHFDGPFETLEDAVEECIVGYDLTDENDTIYVGRGTIPQFKMTKGDAESMLESWVENSDYYEDFWEDFFKPINPQDILALKGHIEQAFVNWVNGRGINIPVTIDVVKEINLGEWKEKSCSDGN